ncbi:hypothetical protein IAU60_002867 [Kwoniella sp. DSM 27419]
MPSKAGGAVSRSLRRTPCLTLWVLALLVRALHLVLLKILGLCLPPFDLSHTLLSPSNLPVLRWDSIHFATIALEGYRWEQQLAFQPVWQGILRVSGEVARVLGGKSLLGVEEIIGAGAVVSGLSWTGATVMLYKLTAHVFPSRRFALLTSLLYLFPPSPVPSLPYTEPTYAFLTFTGLYVLMAKQQYIISGLVFAAATGIRSTGVFNVFTVMGFAVFGEASILDLSWGVLAKRLCTRSWRGVIPSILIISPFLVFQWYAFQSFCSPAAASEGAYNHRPWCTSGLPMAYSFVQGEYWNVGLFKYWTMAQVPNILLALPVFATSLLGQFKYFKRLATGTPGPRLRNSLFILHVQHLLFMLLLLFASHTQITLRVCITDPLIWWNVASLAMRQVPSSPPGGIKGNQGGAQGRGWELTRFGKCWIAWTILWGSVSTVLWAGHYPPA